MPGKGCINSDYLERSKYHQVNHTCLLSSLVCYVLILRWVLFGSLFLGTSQLFMRQLLILSGDVEFNPGPLDQEEDDWNLVIDECSSLAAKWEQLCGFLGLKISLIDAIKQNHPGDNIGCWNDALKHWIKQDYSTSKFGEPSWRMLLKAIVKVDKLEFRKIAIDHQLEDRAAVSIQTQDTRKDSENTNPANLFVVEASCREIGSEGATVLKSSEAAAQQCSGFNFGILTRNPNQLSKEEKELLHQKLYADSEDMMYKFQQLFSATTKSLQERSIPVSLLTRHLECLGSIKPTFKDSGLPPLRHQLPGLANARNVDAVMSVVKDYCSFFNYRMLEHIINELGTEQDKVNLAKYKGDFAKYGERHVFECPSEVGKLSDEGHGNVFVTLDDSFDKCTVNHLQSFISNLQKTLNIPSNIVLKLCRIESGSLKLTFQLPHFVLEDIFPLSSDQEVELSSLGVVQLSCGDYQLINQRQESTKVQVLEHPLVGDLDYTDSTSEGNVSSMQNCDSESVLIAAGASGSVLSSTDSALGRSVVISETTAGVTQVTDDLLLIRELEDFSLGMEPIQCDDPKLHRASRRGQLQVVKHLTEEEFLDPLQTIGNYGWNAIHYAAAAGHLDVLRYFIEERGYSAACVDQMGWTPLHFAARNKHFHVVQYLVGKQQMEPSFRNEYGRTALHIACVGGSIAIIHYLAKEMSKYDVKLTDVVHDRDHEGRIPIHYASVCGHLEAVIFLITELKCNPRITDNMDKTLIHFAAYHGHLHIMKYCIEQLHCDPSRSTVDNVTPLHLAAGKGHLEMVMYLTLEQHCDPLCNVEKTETPFHVAAIFGQLEVIKFCVEILNCPPETKGWLNMTPRALAHSRGHHHIVRYLESISKNVS